MCLSPRCSRPFCDSAAPSQLRAAVRISQLSALPSPNTKCNFCSSHHCCHIGFCCRVWLQVYLKKEVNIALLARQRPPLMQDKQTKRLMISGPIVLPQPEYNTSRSRLAKHASVLHSPCSSSHGYLSVCKVKMELFTGTLLLLPHLII